MTSNPEMRCCSAVFDPLHQTVIETNTVEYSLQIDDTDSASMSDADITYFPDDGLFSGPATIPNHTDEMINYDADGGTGTFDLSAKCVFKSGCEVTARCTVAVEPLP